MAQELSDTGAYIPTIAARLEEIKALDNELVSREHGSRAYQKLPRHMQRRAVSNDPRRVPRQLRGKHCREVGPKVLRKRPSRKYRRRPSNLLNEYRRRQRKNKWLETHIWHAKRFHMIKKWGYCIPESPTNKGYRSTIRAIRETCLIRDVSFEACLELQSPESIYKSVFKGVLSASDFNKLSECSVINGSEWRELTVHQKNKYPFGVVGKIQLSFLPLMEKDIWKMWVWCHPSIEADLIETFVDCYGLQRCSQNTEECDMGNDIGNKNINDAHLTEVNSKGVEVDGKQKNFPLSVPVVYTCANNMVKLTVLTGTLNKFRLRGPLSHSILLNVIRPINVLPETQRATATGASNIEGGNGMDTDDSLNKQQFWWQKFFSEKEATILQENFVKLREFPAFKRNLVIGLVMRDVRYSLPSKKLPADFIADGKEATEVLETLQQTPPSCALYRGEIRHEVTSNMESTEYVNKLRQKILLPGSTLPISESEARVPLLIYAYPSDAATKIEYAFDFIVPSGYGRPTWVSLIKNGAVAGGLVQEEALVTEFCLAPSSYLVADTIAGGEHTISSLKMKRENYFKRPPTCRPNYLKLGAQYPFGVDWMKLIASWCQNVPNFFVLRDETLLNSLAAVTCTKHKKLNERKQLIGLKRLLKRSDKDLPEKGRNPEKNITDEGRDTGVYEMGDKNMTDKPNKRKLDCDDEISNKRQKVDQGRKNFNEVDGFNLESEDTLKCSQDDLVDQLKEKPKIFQRHGEEKVQGCSELLPHMVVATPAYALTYVRLVLIGKGSLEPMAMICVPHKNDFENNNFSMGTSGNTQCTLKERQHTDPNDLARKELKECHKRNMKKMSRLRKEVRKKLKNDEESKVGDQGIRENLEKLKVQNEEAKVNYKNRMEELWLYPQDTQFLQNCSRKIFGYVCQGGFSMSSGRAAGVGYVIWGPLFEHMKNTEVLCTQHLNNLPVSTNAINGGKEVCCDFGLQEQSQTTKDTSLFGQKEIDCDKAAENTDNSALRQSGGGASRPDGRREPVTIEDLHPEVADTRNRTNINVVASDRRSEEACNNYLNKSPRPPSEDRRCIQKKTFVLVRNPSSLCYRWARLVVLNKV